MIRSCTLPLILLAAAVVSIGCKDDEAFKGDCATAAACAPEDADRDFGSPPDTTQDPDGDNAPDEAGSDASTGADSESPDAEDTAGTDGLAADSAEEDAASSDATPQEDVVSAGLAATEAYEREARFGWIVAGQPTEPRVGEIVAEGAVIITLRAVSEETFDEEALVASLGGTFHRYATSSQQYNDIAFREGMYDLYDAQRTAGALVYLHCASGNRAGTSWALYLAERVGVPGEEAIAEGRAAGMSASSESMVRAILGL